MKNGIPWLIVATSLIGSIIQAAVYWPHLHEQVASHFGAGGQADGWMSKVTFVAFTVGLQIGIAVSMLGIGRLIGVLPNSMINIPNKEYWLAKERRTKTLRETIWMMDWIAAGTSVFLLLIFYLAFDANVGENNQLNSFATWGAVVAYTVGLIGFCIVRTMKYYRVPSE